jgi:L-aminopeptidase/D-esterase-like protein
MPERDVEIGRLVLRAPWLDERQGHQLARRVAAGLAAAGTPSDDVSPHLSLAVAAGADDDVDVLSERIVQALARDLELGR